MNRPPIIHDYAVARTIATHHLTHGVQQLAKLMDHWQQATQPQNGGRPALKLANHVDHYQWVLKANFAAQGFGGKDHNGPIKSIVYLDSQYEMLQRLTQVHAKQIARSPSPPSTDDDKTTHLLGKIVRKHIDCQAVHQKFTEDSAIEINWERAGEADKTRENAAAQRSDLAVAITRSDMKFLTECRIIGPIPPL